MKSLYALCLTCFGMLMLSAAAAYSFPIPDISGAKLVMEEKQLVADNDPPTEILIRTFTRPDGMRFRLYSVKGSIFRYDIDEDGITPYEYRLIDSDGDGVFETREELVGEMTEGEKDRRYYIDIGEEPGKEYHYSYETKRPEGVYDDRIILRGDSIFIPAWVVVEFK